MEDEFPTFSEEEFLKVEKGLRDWFDRKYGRYVDVRPLPWVKGYRGLSIKFELPSDKVFSTSDVVRELTKITNWNWDTTSSIVFAKDGIINIYVQFLRR